MLKQANKKGFTIIEVVITIAIGAAVMALVLNAVQGARRSQRNNARVADVGSVAAAANQYYGSRNTLPDTTADIDDPLFNQLAYYAPDNNAAAIQGIFVAAAWHANSNVAGAFPEAIAGATNAAGDVAVGAQAVPAAALTTDALSLVRQAACNDEFSEIEVGGIREMVIVYRLEGQDGVVCREI